MTAWYSKSLGDGMLAYEPQCELEAHFLELYEQAGYPVGMALFIRHESDGRVHCEVKAYFSPASAAVAIEEGAQPCRRPSVDSLSLLAGSEQSWLLFPERI